MLTVISPAKRLNEMPSDLDMTAPVFQDDAARLARIAKKLTADDLCNLMHISPVLGALNRARFARFAKDPARFPAAFLFDGDTYAGLDARAMMPETLNWAQSHLRILSGLYGILRPMDGIQPYRLEMGSRLANPRGSNLYSYWGRKIGTALRAEAKGLDTDILVNCASNEYFGAVDLAALKLRVITPTFLEQRDGQAKIVSFWAKKARGAMARFISAGRLLDPNDLRAFDFGGYAFNAELSRPDQPAFTRPAVVL